MIVSMVTLLNWGCFRGAHVIPLNAGVYGVTARHEDDPTRSNWLGKTKFTQAILFALTGEHGNRHEDDWITDGESEGSVVISLHADLHVGGPLLTVGRARKRGKPTKVSAGYWTGAEKVKALGDEAQALVDRLVGLKHDDLVTSSFVAQKQMSKFVVAKPGDRMDIVASWLRLEPLQKCEKIANDRLTEWGKSLANGEAKCAALKAQIEATPAHDEAALNKASEEADQVVAKLEKLREEGQQHAHDVRDHAEFARVAEAGKAARAIVDAANGAALEKDVALSAAAMNETAAVLRATKLTVQQKLELCRGEFDGKCPVTPIACPAKAKINGMIEEHKEAADLAREAYRKQLKRHEEATVNHTGVSAALRAHEAVVTRLEGLRQQARHLKPAADRISAGGLLAPIAVEGIDVEQARGRAAEARAQVLLAGTDAKRGVALRAALLVAEEEVAILKVHVGLLRQAVQVFGKGGAQRRVAEDALSDIEATANSLLGACGMDLTVEVTWGREGKDLADNCDQCGAPFGTSQRVKVCGRCAAPRGQKITNRLDLELSDKSGAAEDLAGWAFQFAAGAWLRRDRGSAWGVAVMDEPFGSLDEANRKQLAGHLPALLSECGFSQAFVIAHHGGIMYAMSHRVEIVAGPTGSKVTAS